MHFWKVLQRTRQWEAFAASLNLAYRIFAFLKRFENILCNLGHGHHDGGLTVRLKKLKAPLFLEILKNPFKRLLQWVQNLTNFFLFQISQQIGSLEVSKVLAKMGRG